MLTFFLKKQQILFLTVSVVFDVCFHCLKGFHTFDPVSLIEIVQQCLERSPGSLDKSVTELPQ